MARSSTTQRMIDAGLLTKEDVFDANWDKLMGFAQTIGNRGSWRTTPTPPPLDFAGPQLAYRNALTQTMKQNAVLKELEEREALKKSLAMNPAGDPAAAARAALTFAGPAYVPGVAPHTTAVSKFDTAPRVGTEAAATTPFMGPGKGVYIDPNVPQGGQIDWENPADAAKWREIYSRRQTPTYNPYAGDMNDPMRREALVESGGFLGPGFRPSPGQTSAQAPRYDALARARGPGFMSPEAIKAAALDPRADRQRQLTAAERYKQMYPVALEASRFPPALRGMPNARLISAIGQSHPLKAIDFASKLRLKPGDVPSSVREFEYYENLSDEGKKKFLGVKRAASKFDLGGTVLAGHLLDEMKKFQKTLAPKEQPSLKEAQAASSAAGTEIGREVVAARFGLPQARMEAVRIKRMTDGLLNHPAFSTVIGWKTNIAGMVARVVDLPGSDEADFVARLEQIGGATFMQAYKVLKGGGQITEIEGKKATAAYSRLEKTNVPEKDYKKAIKDYIRFVENTLEITEKTARHKLKLKIGIPFIEGIEHMDKEQLLSIPMGTVRAFGKDELKAYNNRMDELKLGQ